MARTLLEWGQALSKGPLIFAVVILVTHTLIAYALDAAGLIESLLSPSGTRVFWILPLAVIFYALRITAYFIVPGVVVGSLILGAWTNRAVTSNNSKK